MIKSSRLKFEKVAITKGAFPFEGFKLKPIELEEYLDEYIIGQKQAKAVISTKICTHFHKVRFILTEKIDHGEFIKNNILIIGPTGVGKTYMMKIIAKKLGIPFVKGDATKFSETGYVGGDIEDLIRELYWEAGGDLEKAHFGMIFLDEIDKIASAGETIGPDVSRTGVQRALLKPLEETNVEIKIPQDGYGIFEFHESSEKGKRKRLILNTKYVLFVASGAFQGLEEIIKKRLKKQNIGFISDLSEKEEVKVNYLKLVTPEDLVAYGFEREFVGRFPVIAVFDPLTEEELFEILSNPNNPIILNKKRDFKVYGIDIAFTDGALREIAKLAYKENTGARALSLVMEKILVPFERALPSHGIKYFPVTEDTIKDPEGILNLILSSPKGLRLKEDYLKALDQEKKRVETYVNRKLHLFGSEKFELTSKRLNIIFEMYKGKDMELNKAVEEILFLWKQIKNYEKTFERKKGIRIIFSEEVVDFILEEIIKKDWGVFAYCEKLISRLEYVLTYIKDILEGDEFVITLLALKNPDRYFNKYLKELKS